MNWLDILERRGRQAMQPAVVQPAAVQPLTARAISLPKPEIKHVWVQTRAPSGDDIGEVEAGFYFVSDGVLIMCDEDGKPVRDGYQLAPGDDPHLVAGRLKWRALQKDVSDFNRPLGYARFGIA